MKNNVILAHCGPWAKSQFELIAKGLDPDAKLVMAGMDDACDDVGLKPCLIDAVADGERTENEFGDPRFEEEILRCRFLRNIPRKQAGLYLSVMDRVWDDVLREVQPAIVISEMVDSFVNAGLERACVRHQIVFMGLVTCFVDGYFRVTRYGEHVRYRSPTTDEIDRVTKMLLSKKYMPGFVSTPKHPELMVLRRWLKNWARVLYYGLLALLPSNRVDLNVRANLIVARQSLHILPRFRLGSPDWHERARCRGLPIMILPLQLIPEATVDYWTTDVRRIKYDEVLLEVLDRLAGRFTFVVKEHPNVLGDRHPKLYRELERRSDVIFAATWTTPSELLEFCDGVLVWTGSMGFEAALRGKAVLALTPAYYMSGSRFLILEDDASPALVEDFVVSTKACPITDKEQREMVEYLLSGLIPGKIVFRNNFDSVRDKYTDPHVIGENMRDVKCSLANALSK